MKKEAHIHKVQDGDGHWYWIPNYLIGQFKLDLEVIEGKDYMDCPIYFDRFIERYEEYRTGGSPDNKPEGFNGI